MIFLVQIIQTRNDEFWVLFECVSTYCLFQFLWNLDLSCVALPSRKRYNTFQFEARKCTALWGLFGSWFTAGNLISVFFISKRFFETEFLDKIPRFRFETIVCFTNNETLIGLGQFIPLVSLYTSWKHYKGFLCSGRRERDQWYEMS